MPAYARAKIVSPDEVGIYHCVTRCVRRAFLCGIDLLSGKNYEHRKDWIRERLEELAAEFAIEVCGYAVMSNHLHVVLRTRPDLVRDWTDEEVAFRWKRLFPDHDPATREPVAPSELDVKMILADPERVKDLRERLSNLSWFMRCLCEPIARRANRDDKCSGRFFEGRFKSQALLDDAAILACSIYVDLNPIRAGIAETPEQSEYTSALDRIRSMTPVGPPTAESPATIPPNIAAHAPRDSVPANPRGRPDSWLCELTLDESPKAGPAAKLPVEACGAGAAKAEAQANATYQEAAPTRPARASDQGYLPIQLEKYLLLLDWTGREVRAKSRGAIPADLAPILERLGINAGRWTETVRHFGRWFKTAAGRLEAMASLAARRGKAWLHGQRAAAFGFH
jgi:REP element-mobilizing transposase RayT